MALRYKRVTGIPLNEDGKGKLQAFGRAVEALQKAAPGEFAALRQAWADAYTVTGHKRLTYILLGAATAEQVASDG